MNLAGGIDIITTIIVVCKVSVLEVSMKPGVVVYKDGLRGVVVDTDHLSGIAPMILVEHDYGCRWYFTNRWSEEEPAQVSEEYMELFT